MVEFISGKKKNPFLDRKRLIRLAIKHKNEGDYLILPRSVRHKTQEQRNAQQLNSV